MLNNNLRRKIWSSVALIFMWFNAAALVNAQSNSPRLTLAIGHADHIVSMDYSPDGKILASGDKSGALKFWDVKSGREIRTLQGPQGTGDGVWQVAFSPNGGVLATRSGSRVVTIWDVDTGLKLRTMELVKSYGHGQISFSPDGQELVVGGGVFATLFDVNTGLASGLLYNDHYGINNVIYSPDGNTIVSSSGPGAIIYWNESTTEAIKGIELKNGLGVIAYSPNGKYLAVDNGDKVALLDAVYLSELNVFFGHEKSRVYSIRFSPKGDVLASTWGNGDILIWDVLSGKLLRTLKQKVPDLHGTKLSPKRGG